MQSQNTPSSAPSPQEPPALSRSLVVTLRVALLIMAAGAVIASVAIAVHHDSSPNSGPRYTCPMHPEVKTAKPGECPICHMNLEPMAKGGADNPKAHSDRRGMADLTAVENVRKHKIVDFVRMRSLLQNTREMRGPAWVEEDRTITALFYNDQIAALQTSEPGDFLPTQSPTATVAVRRGADAPVAWDRSTSRVRFAIDPRHPKRTLQPGQVGWLVLSPKARKVLGVPSAAVVQSPEGPYVLAWVGGLNFEKRPIEIGESFLKQGFAVVLSGLGPQDRVVSKATFFVDADRRLGDPSNSANSSEDSSEDSSEGWVVE
jgi:hypothetical protein